MTDEPITRIELMTKQRFNSISGKFDPLSEEVEQKLQGLDDTTILKVELSISNPVSVTNVEPIDSKQFLKTAFS